MFFVLSQYIAEKILKLNERGTWLDPPPQDAAERARQEEEVFQTARLIKYVLTCPCFPWVVCLTALALAAAVTSWRWSSATMWQASSGWAAMVSRGA